MNPSMPEHERWRAALREGVEIARDGADCPAAERIWDSAAGALSRADDAAVLRHVAQCTACGLAWELARELGAQAAAEKRTMRFGTLRRPWVWAAAAVVVVAVLGSWWIAPRHGLGTAPVYRDTSGDWITSEIPEHRPLARDDCVLRWKAGPPGTTYDVGVTGERLEPVARAWALDRAEYRVDRSALEKIPPGGRILWRVTAHLPDGGQVVSRTFLSKLE